LRVIGTAGHVDHGKSKLVEALTGIDPDRLKEEKEREMTIDLGFAWLTLPSGQTVSIVDVPGHEDFIKNMLAGVGGIDAALFVVAADEGVMPQTKEHLAILDLLQVKGGVVALTKVDLVEDEEWLELVTAEVAEEIEGTTLAGARIIPVSVKTGEGLPALLEELDRLMTMVAPKMDIGRPRLPIDRVFTIAGFGTVVTGTLIDGRFHVGQEVEILPEGLKARIRGLQTHKESIETAIPGSRVAINLAGVSTDELQRGDVVTIPGWLSPTRVIDVRLQLLSDAPKPLRHNVAVELFTGSAQVMAKTRLLDSEAIAPGGTGWVQLRLAEPIAVVKEDRFIVRQPSPPLTIGGGGIVDPHPRRHRRFRPEVIARLETLARGKPEEIILQALERGGPQRVRELIRDSGLPEEAAEVALDELIAGSQALLLGGEHVISAAGWAELLGRIAALLRQYHQQSPLRVGMPREELKSRLRLSPRLFNEAIARAAAEGRVVEAEATLRLPEHEVRFSPEQQSRVNKLLAAIARSPYAPPSVADCQAMVGAEVLEALIEQGRLVKVSDSVLFSAEAYEEMVGQVVACLKEEGSITVAQVRDMFGASRKYALALMEHLDERRVTKRVGDERVLR